ncbi:hypothetical protein LWI29_029465 [Acer saccharum]|uniref:MRN complex-interacting protein N-terminal domain-containing protein n=1 Tax=Acer saccharum TaxID=4024 RepID=A0AA39T6B5_ACESA|nr:hypothetical protein LWI29_029465 [Acer saccharum]
MTQTSNIDPHPDTSLALPGPSAVAGAKPPGPGLGGLLPEEGNSAGLSVGVSELKGTLTGASGDAAITGPSVVGGAQAGVVAGELTGVTAGGETDCGGLAETYVKQKKKSSNKWTCVVCNQKQSVRKVFAQGYNAKDLRQYVQSFNMSLKDRPHEEQQEEEEET